MKSIPNSHEFFLRRKVFWGGLLSAGTPATTEAAATLLMNKEMPDDKIPEFMASLAFVKHPTEETLNILSVSKQSCLINNKYCSLLPLSCETLFLDTYYGTTEQTTNQNTSKTIKPWKN